MRPTLHPVFARWRARELPTSSGVRPRAARATAAAQVPIAASRPGRCTSCTIDDVTSRMAALALQRLQQGHQVLHLLGPEHRPVELLACYRRTDERVVPEGDIPCPP